MQVSYLIDMLTQFSKEKHNQEYNNQKELHKAKQILEVNTQDLLDLEEEGYFLDDGEVGLKKMDMRGRSMKNLMLEEYLKLMLLLPLSLFLVSLLDVKMGRN
ncbi:hypothetical protein PIB30_085634 [Stylosanthes scabra]|uniref:Uncharacterized protein n=1 Tax=Stylosanthes scabra TaxID=79078 RepID=A0ABU6YSE1_9FABA|nr:hypothetical protein [Stylosanthes scabra]